MPLTKLRNFSIEDNNITSNKLASVNRIISTANIVSTAGIIGSQNIDVLSNATYLFTGTTSGNVTLNLRGNSTTTLNASLATGESVEIIAGITNGLTGYVANVAIDGVVQSTLWSGNTRPSGSSYNTDLYHLRVFKTGSATYNVYGEKVNFGTG
jgi:hypothetical protein